MTKEYSVDPRAKLILALCITSLAVLFDDITYNMIVLVMSLITAFALRADLKKIVFKLKPLLIFFIILSLVQSIFSPSGKIYAEIFDIPLLTGGGIEKGTAFLLRMLLIISSGIIISTSARRDLTQGLIQMKIPYEIAFMTNIAILFIPSLGDEIKSSITAIELRGIDIKSLKLKERINLYGHLVMPIILRSVNSARTIAMAMDVRAFRLYKTRTCLKILRLKFYDYIIITIALAISIIVSLKYLGVI